MCVLKQLVKQRPLLSQLWTKQKAEMGIICGCTCPLILAVFVDSLDKRTVLASYPKGAPWCNNWPKASWHRYACEPHALIQEKSISELQWRKKNYLELILVTAVLSVYYWIFHHAVNSLFLEKQTLFSIPIIPCTTYPTTKSSRLPNCFCRTSTYSGCELYIRQLKIQNEAKQMEFHNQVYTIEGLMMHRLFIFKLIPVILLHLFEAVIESSVFSSVTPKDDSILLIGKCCWGLLQDWAWPCSRKL